MPRKKAEKPEVTEETMDRTPDEQKEAVLSDPDEKSPEGTEGESGGEEISQTETENLENKMTLSSGTKEQEADSEKESHHHYKYILYMQKNHPMRLTLREKKWM